ncbi:hypothetical protein MMYC01_207148 [Madurella mycetomatis]|uniref:SMP-30/Gluconolactonase/LRE-like region domain-containing protein n=1 Tax=Madurella mycetomatis TaxID=100816 RepID=A0A175W0B3_9PEZI|nr:hypothetical protein MMYC01_207148 [Madurella mycetomatis]
MRPFRSFLAVGLSLAVASPVNQRQASPKVTELLRFPGNTRLENLNILPNGYLIINTLNSSDVFTVDPSDSLPQPNKLVTLPDGSSLFGITALDNGLYAVVSGIASPVPHHYLLGSFQVHVIDPFSETNVLIKSIPVPDTEFLNGLTSLPEHPHVVLGADSFAGSILRIDTHTDEVVTAFSSPALGFGNATGLQIGVNGVRIRDGYLYFTNSRLGTFSRLRIDEDGFPLGEPQVIAILPGWEDGEHLWDDFDFDEEGNVYVTAHPSSLIKVSEEGEQETIVGGDGDDTLGAPTGVALEQGGKAVWVTSMIGQVVRVEI